VEGAGIPTVNLSINLDISRKVPAPRTVFVRYPHGAPFGVPGDATGHPNVLLALFRALYEIREPGTIVDPGYRWRRTSWAPAGPEEFRLPRAPVESWENRAPRGGR